MQEKELFLLINLIQNLLLIIYVINHDHHLHIKYYYKCLNDNWTQNEKSNYNYYLDLYY